MDIETPLFHLLSTCFPPLDSGISLRHVTRDNRIVSVILYPTGSSSPLAKIGLSKKRSALRRLLGLYRQTQMGSFRKWVSWNGVYQYTNIYHPKWTKMALLGVFLRRKEDKAWEFAGVLLSDKLDTPSYCTLYQFSGATCRETDSGRHS